MQQIMNKRNKKKKKYQSMEGKEEIMNEIKKESKETNLCNDKCIKKRKKKESGKVDKD